jgi:hypothetical protein
MVANLVKPQLVLTKSKLDLDKSDPLLNDGPPQNQRGD